MTELQSKVGLLPKMPSSLIHEAEMVFIQFMFLASRLTTLIAAVLAIWCFLSRTQMLAEFPIHTGPLSDWIDWILISIAAGLSGRAYSTLRPVIKCMSDAGIQAVQRVLAGRALTPTAILEANRLPLSVSPSIIIHPPSHSTDPF
jgi:hypothetical protein